MLPLIGSALGAVGGIFSMFGNKGKTQLETRYYDPNVKDFTDSYGGRLKDLNAEDDARFKSNLSDFEGLKPGVGNAYARDLDFLSQIGPGGAQEQRFLGTINAGIENTKRAAEFGRQRAIARAQARRATLGQSLGFSPRELAAMGNTEAEFNAGLEQHATQQRLGNMNKFLGLANDNVGRVGGLSHSYMKFLQTPSELARERDDATLGRVNKFEGITKGNQYMVNKPKSLNWADYVGGSLNAVGGALGGGLLGGGGGGGGNALGGSEAPVSQGWNNLGSTQNQWQGTGE